MAGNGHLSDSAVLRIMRSKAVDPAASVASTVLLIASILGLPERLDLTASELGILIFSIGTLVTTLRTIAERRI